MDLRGTRTRPLIERAAAVLAMLVLAAGCSSTTSGSRVGDAALPSTGRSGPATASPPIATAPATGSASDPTCTKTVGGHDQPYSAQLACAMAIPGVQWHAEPQHDHTTSTVSYDTSPPVGGNHSPLWANCTGTVYTTQIANENAVHMLEHGAVWITYRPGLPAAQLATLAALVRGHDRLALSPYAGLKTAISLQAWGHQLFVDSASDPRIARFVAVLSGNLTNTPEPGASCSDPYFDPKLSTPGHPQETA